jgi:hypothetical protein
MSQNGQVLDLSCPTVKSKKSADRVQEDTPATFWDFDS